MFNVGWTLMLWHLVPHMGNMEWGRDILSHSPRTSPARSPELPCHKCPWIQTKADLPIKSIFKSTLSPRRCWDTEVRGVGAAAGFVHP